MDTGHADATFRAERPMDWWVTRDQLILYTEQLSAVSAACHSSSLAALRARKLIPSVPNCAALEACGASAYTSTRDTISKFTNPAATTVACSSVSTRAPAIHPFHKSMSRLAPSPTSLCTIMSPN